VTLSVPTLLLPVALGVFAWSAAPGAPGAPTDQDTSEADAAWAAQRDAVAAAGAAATPVMLHNLALEAVGRGALREAETQAQRALTAGGDGFAHHAEAILGMVAFERSRQAEAQATGPEAEPFAFDAAIAYARSARDRWVRAVVGRRLHDDADWPRMRRNVERAMAHIERLTALRDANRKDPLSEAADPTINPKLVPQDAATPPDPDTPQPRPERPDGQDDPDQLQPEQVLAYLRLLDQKQQDKRALRTERRQQQSSAVERDW